MVGVIARIRRWSSCMLGVPLLLLVPAAAVAQDDPDAQVWVQVLALGTMGNGWRTHAELQPRVMNDASEVGLTIVRAALGRPLGRRTTVWGGYAWVPRTLGEGVRHEQRTWQQVQVTPAALAGWSSSLRLRLEQRWLTPWDGPSHRARLLGRGQYALETSRRWSVYAYDELMLTLANTPRGPIRGFDRNRLSSGLTRRLSPVFSTDVGYLWEHAVAPDGRRDDHVVIAVINVSAPR